MIITKNQLEEIRRGLAVLGVRDTDLPDATTLTGAELVAIVQGNENRKVAVGDLFGKYLEDMLPYAVRGMSAYEVAVANGYTGTVEQWLASLQAAIEIDNSFVGGVSKVASAEEAKWLKDSLAALQGIALTSDDVVNSLSSGATDKPLSAAMGKELKRLIDSGSGQSVNVVDNLNSNSGTDALSAKQGKVLKDLIDAMIELNNGIKKIYKWSEIDQIARTGVIPEDIYNDSITAISDARVAYELLKLLRSLDARVTALEKGSGGGGGDDGGDSEGDSGDSDGDSEDEGGGSDYETPTIKLVPAMTNKDGALRIDPNGIFIYTVVNSDGSISETQSDTFTYDVIVENTDSEWEIVMGATATWSTWMNVTKLDNSIILDASEVVIQGRTSDLTVRLVDKNYIKDTITLSQSPRPVELRITDFSGSRSGVLPAIGGSTSVIVTSPSHWELYSKPDWVTVYDWKGRQLTNVTGEIGETQLVLKVSSEVEETRFGDIVVRTSDGEAFYRLVQDASLVDSIRLLDNDGTKTVSLANMSWPNYPIYIYATGAWTVTIPQSARDWLSFTGGGYVQSGEATDGSGQQLNLAITRNDTEYDDTTYIEGVLTGTGHKALLSVTHWAKETGSPKVYAYFTNDVSEDGGATSLVVDYIKPGKDFLGSYWIYEEDIPAGVTFPEKYYTTNVHGLSSGPGYKWTCGHAGDWSADGMIEGILVDDTIDAGTYNIPVFVMTNDSVPDMVTAELIIIDSSDASSDMDSLVVTGFPSSKVEHDVSSFDIYVTSTYGWTVGSKNAMIKKNGSDYTDSDGGEAEQITVVCGTNTGSDTEKIIGVYFYPKGNVSKVELPLGYLPLEILQETDSDAVLYTTDGELGDEKKKVYLDSQISTTDNFYVHSSGSWSVSGITGDPDVSVGEFFTVSPLDGLPGGTTVVVTSKSANDKTSARTGSITLSAPRCEDITVQVHQRERQIESNKTVFEFDSNTGSQEFSVAPYVFGSPGQDCRWKLLTEGATWASIATQNQKTVVSVTSNSGNTRYATIRVYVYGDEEHNHVDFSIKQLAPGGGGDDDPIVPDTPEITIANGYITITCDTAGATIYYRIGNTTWSVYGGSIAITDDMAGLQVGAFSSLDGVDSVTVYEIIPGEDESEYDSGGYSSESSSDESGYESEYDSEYDSEGEGEASIATPPYVVWPDADAHTNANVKVTVSGPNASSLTWTASSSGNHITLDTLSGTGTGYVYYDIDANDDTTAGTTGSITVTLDSDSTKSCTCTITQTAKPAPVQTEFVVSKNSVSLDENNTSDTLTITCNKDWTATSPSWLNMSPSSGDANETVTVTVSVGVIQEGQSKFGEVTAVADGDSLERALFSCSYTASSSE